MNKHSLPLAALIAGLAGLPLAASAGPDDFHGFFVGGGAGSNSVNGSDYTGNGNDVDDRQIAYKALAGYRFNPIASLEAQYIDFGTAEGGNNRVKAHGLTLGGTLNAPITTFVHPYAKLEALFWDADDSFNGLQRSDTGTDFAYGAGARLIFGRQINVRGEYERFEFQDTDVHTISAMLQLNF